MNSEFKRWFADKGDEFLRVNYPLTADSIVVDAGAYVGDWADAIMERYGCTVIGLEPARKSYSKLIQRFSTKPKFKAVDVALWDKKEVLAMDGVENVAKVTTLSKGAHGVAGCPLSEVMKRLEIGYIDLLKLNIEGAEYRVLENIISEGLIQQINHLQIQFHAPSGKAGDLRRKLEQTHFRVWNYPGVWESWTRKTASSSQAAQDLFARFWFPEGYKGTYLEVGCGHPTFINNTNQLALQGWTGVSIDSRDFQPEWNAADRKGFIQADAFQVDYCSLELPCLVDYLSLDIEAHAGSRFQALKRVLAAGLEFRVITMEHDSYRGYDDIEKIPQRELLTNAGYQLVNPDVSMGTMPFEDWWIHPKHILRHGNL